jgi:RNA polymerase sigma-70 factor (ECF subfamily)
MADAGTAPADASDAATSWFVRYRAGRDGADLERALMDCAPALLRVARIWERDAEDLVQEAFVVAIRDVDRFDGARPLLPWLLGILRNVARSQRRRRRARTVAAVEERADDSSLEPAAIVDRRQWRALVAQEIGNLPEPYSSVLTRHLVSGEAAFEIATQLKRSPSTVRTQVERGLRELRRRLPAPLLAGLAAVLAARSAAAGSLPPAPSGRTRSGLLVGAALGIAAWFAWLQLPVLPSPPSVLAAAAPVDARPATSAAAAENDPPARSVAADTEAAVRVRLRNPDGEPLEGVPVVLDPQFVRGQPLPRSHSRWRVAHTDAQGIATFRDVASGNAALRLHDHAVLQEFTAGSGGHSFEFEVQIATTMLVQLVDADQVPVAGGTVYLSCRNGDGTAPGYPAARTDAAGQARVPVVLPRSWLWATADGHTASAVEGPISAMSSEPVLVARLGRPAVPRRGRVEDSAGRPLAGADVAAWSREPGSRGMPVLFTRTGPDGQFELGGLPPGAWAAAAVAPGLAAARAELHADAEPALLRLSAGGELEGRLQAMPLGRAPSLRIGTMRADAVDTPVDPFEACAATVGANGSFRIGNVAQGEHMVGLFELGNAKPLAERRVAVRDGTTTAVEFGADGIVPWEVLVQDEHGLPVPQCLVRASSPMPLVGSKHEQEARTDANGVARLARRDTCEQSLFAYLPRGTETNDVPAVELARVMPSARTVVTLPESARKLGSVRGCMPVSAGIFDRQNQFELARPGGTRILVAETDGSFAVEQLPAGAYRLLIRQRGGKLTWIQVIAELELRAGEHLDLGQIPGRDAGMALLVVGEGTAATAVPCALRDARGTVLETFHLAPGSPHRRRLFAGRYSLSYPVPDLSVTERSFEVRGDTETRVELAHDPGAVCRIEVALDGGSPASAWLLASVTATATGATFDFMMPPRRRHCAIEVELLPGEYRLAARAPWGGEAAGTFVVRAGGVENVFSFPLR